MCVTLGEIGALSGTAVWLLIAGIFSLPVSATQSVFGATVGFNLVFHGTRGINLSKIIQISKFQLVFLFASVMGPV